MKEGGREGNVRAVGLGDQVFFWLVEFSFLVWRRDGDVQKKATKIVSGLRETEIVFELL